MRFTPRVLAWCLVGAIVCILARCASAVFPNCNQQLYQPNGANPGNRTLVNPPAGGWTFYNVCSLVFNNPPTSPTWSYAFNSNGQLKSDGWIQTTAAQVLTDAASADSLCTDIYSKIVSDAANTPVATSPNLYQMLTCGTSGLTFNNPSSTNCWGEWGSILRGTFTVTAKQASMCSTATTTFTALNVSNNLGLSSSGTAPPLAWSTLQTFDAAFKHPHILCREIFGAPQSSCVTLCIPCIQSFPYNYHQAYSWTDTYP